MVDHLTIERRSHNMAAIKGRDTVPEMKVRRIVHKLGYRYRLHKADLPGKPDIVLSGRKSVIFVNGCFWHGHSCAKGKRQPRSNLDYWNAKRSRNAARDATNIATLQNKGWRVLVIWECETKDPEYLTSQVRSFLSKTAP